MAALQMESEVLFEGVNNALKPVGDKHMARLCAAAAKRFHLPEWIIILIAVSIVLRFLPGVGK